MYSISFQDFSECKKVLCERGKLFLGNVFTARKVIAKLFLPYIHENYVSKKYFAQL